jgi:putative oxidoreductase
MVPLRVMRTVARLLLAWVFVYGGQDVLRRPEPRAKIGGPFIDSVRAVLPVLPEDKILLVRANAALMVSAGLLLGLGKAQRLAALALATCLIPTTLGGHRYWTFDDPQQRAQQVIHVNKNLAMLGGLVLYAFSLADRRRLAR